MEPVEYILGYSNGKKRTYQYIKILETTQKLLNRSDVQTILHGQDPSQENVYSSFRDGKYFVENKLFRED